MTREPLPYRHERTIFPDGFLPFACTAPESAGVVSLEAHFQCPGCRAAAFALAVNNPGQEVVTASGRKLLIGAIRERYDDLDPMRVLFERALADRGIA